MQSTLRHKVTTTSNASQQEKSLCVFAENMTPTRQSPNMVRLDNRAVCLWLQCEASLKVLPPRRFSLWWCERHLLMRQGAEPRGQRKPASIHEEYFMFKTQSIGWNLCMRSELSKAIVPSQHLAEEQGCLQCEENRAPYWIRAFELWTTNADGAVMLKSCW